MENKSRQFKFIFMITKRVSRIGLLVFPERTSLFVVSPGGVVCKTFITLISRALVWLQSKVFVHVVLESYDLVEPLSTEIANMFPLSMLQVDRIVVIL